MVNQWLITTTENLISNAFHCCIVSILTLNLLEKRKKHEKTDNGKNEYKGSEMFYTHRNHKHTNHQLFTSPHSSMDYYQ